VRKSDRSLRWREERGTRERERDREREREGGREGGRGRGREGGGSFAQFASASLALKLEREVSDAQCFSKERRNRF